MDFVSNALFNGTRCIGPAHATNAPPTWIWSCRTQAFKRAVSDNEPSAVTVHAVIGSLTFCISDVAR